MLKSGLFINPFGIGDVLFTTPLLHTVKDAFADIRLGYLCNRRIAPVLENNPFIDRVFIYERDEFESLRRKSLAAWTRKSLELINEIKRERFGFALDFSMNSQYGFFSLCAGIKTRIGYDYKGRGWLLNRRIKFDGYKDRHVVEYHGRLLKFIGLDPKFQALELYLNAGDKRWADEFLRKNGIRPDELSVGIIPGAGASWGKDAYLKHWPAEHFAGLADKIIANYKAKIIIMGDSNDKITATEVSAAMRNRAVDAAGQTGLGEFAALIDRMNLVVTNDGGPLHMASALGVKAVSIFGPVDERVYGPYPQGGGQVAVKKGLDCQPCYNAFRMPQCPRGRQCLTALSPDEVYGRVKEML